MKTVFQSLSKVTLSSLAFSSLFVTSQLQAQDYSRALHFVGSSTVFPFASSASATFGRRSSFPTPVVESTGTGSGFQIFCSGIDPETPDFINASRAIKPEEKELCYKNGVTDISELSIGKDGIVVAQNRNSETLNLTVNDFAKALSASAVIDGEVVANPYQRWSDINPDFPDSEILVLGPSSVHGTYDTLIELVLHPLCKSDPAFSSLSSSDQKLTCGALRTDGVYIPSGENYTVMVNKTAADPRLVGIFTYSYLENNIDRIKAINFNGIEPTLDSISEGDYPLARDLFIYTKNHHKDFPGFQPFLKSFFSYDSISEEGSLLDLGLIPHLDEKFDEAVDRALTLPNLFENDNLTS